MSMQVATHDPSNQTHDAAIARRAAEVLRTGGLVVFPTETVYGVAASANHEQGLAKLNELKGGSDAVPRFAVHVAHAETALSYLDGAGPQLRRLVERILPGPVTLIVERTAEQMARASEQLGFSQVVAERVFHDGEVVLRCPDHPLTQSMLARVGGPVLAGAARTPGQGLPLDASDAMRGIGARVDLVVDGGRCRFAKPSALVRISENRGQTSSGGVRIDVERPGIYDAHFLRKLMGYSILFVCSGNTCRSPMAEAIARQLLADRQQIEPGKLDEAGLSVASAGVFAMNGAPATTHAVEALKKQGIDLTSHHSRSLTLDMVQQADAIFCMTEAHRQAVLDLAPMAAAKVHLLDDSGDIDDPIGSNATTYQRTAEMIRRRMSVRLTELNL